MGVYLPTIIPGEPDLSGASFENAILRNVKFEGAKVKGVHGTNLIGEEISDAPDCIKETSCPDRILSGKIFVSRLGVLDSSQTMFVNAVKDIVEQSKLSCLELPRDLYDASNVLSRLSDKVGSCSAMIVFGFKSIHVKDGVFRPGTADSREMKDMFFSTPWNQLEVGMAVKNHIPVLLLIEEGITDGVFDHQINDELLTKLSLKCCLDEKQDNVRSWLKSVIKQVPEQSPE